MFYLNIVDYPLFGFLWYLWSTWNDLGPTLRDTQGLYLNHVLPVRPSKNYSVGGWVGGLVVAHKILVTAQRPIPLSLFRI